MQLKYGPPFGSLWATVSPITILYPALFKDNALNDELNIFIIASPSTIRAIVVHKREQSWHVHRCKKRHIKKSVVLNRIIKY